MDRKMPLAVPLLKEVVYALPPLRRGARVCDLGGGTGRASAAVLAAYPGVVVTLLDGREESVHVASNALPMITAMHESLVPGAILPGAGYDAIVATMSLHSIVGHTSGSGDAADTYARLFSGVLASLKPGGHLVVGDHQKQIGLFHLMGLMEAAGFRDVGAPTLQTLDPKA